MLSLSDKQLNKTSFVDTEAPLDLSITNDIASSKVDDKQDDFNFEIDSEFIYGDAPHLMVYYIFRSLFVLQEYVQM